MTYWLLPHRFKVPGVFLFIVSGGLGLLQIITGYEWPVLKLRVFAILNSELLGKVSYFSWHETNVTATLLGMVFIAGGLMAGFSKEKQDDEYIRSLRWAALTWSVWLNYILLFLAFVFVYGVDFLSIMVYNMFTILLFFNARYYYLLYLAKHQSGYDESA